SMRHRGGQWHRPSGQHWLLCRRERRTLRRRHYLYAWLRALRDILEEAYYNRADVVLAAVHVRLAHQQLDGLVGIGDTAQDALDLRVTNHLPQAVRAHQQLVASLEWQVEGIHLDRFVLVAQAAIDLIAPRVLVDVLWTDDA